MKGHKRHADPQARDVGDLSSVPTNGTSHSASALSTSPMAADRGKSEVCQRMETVRDVTGDYGHDRATDWYGKKKRPDAEPPRRDTPFRGMSVSMFRL